jgi:hypothetical protein
MGHHASAVAYPREMAAVVISFLDGEVLFAETPEIAFDLPVIEARVTNVDANSEQALIPTSSIRQIIVGEVEPAPPASTLESWDKAVFHFIDGQILHAFISPDAALGRHGGIWRLVERGSDELRTLAVPYSSLKAVFRVRLWDSRSANERAARDAGVSPHLDTVVRVLAERELRSHGPVRQEGEEAPLISRMRRAARRTEQGG